MSLTLIALTATDQKRFSQLITWSVNKYSQLNNGMSKYTQLLVGTYLLSKVEESPSQCWRRPVGLDQPLTCGGLDAGGHGVESLGELCRADDLRNGGDGVQPGVLLQDKDELDDSDVVAVDGEGGCLLLLLILTNDLCRMIIN